MKLALQVIFDRLMNTYPDAVWNLPDPMMEVERPVAYEPGTAPERGRLYLCDHAPKELCAPGFALVCTGELPATAEGNILAVSDSVLRVLNVIQIFWDELDCWMAELEQTTLRRGSVSALLKRSLPVIGNPIFLIDSEFTLRAEAGESELPQQKRIYRDNINNMELFNAVVLDDQFRSHQDSPEPILTLGRVLPFRAWIVNIMQDGSAAYQLVLAENARTLRSGDGWLLKRLSECVSYLLEQERLRMYTDNGLHSVFLRLLSESAADLDELSRRLSQLGWGVQDAYLCAAFSHGMKQTEADESRLWRYLERQYPFCCCTPYQDHIVCFFDLTALGLDEETLCSQLKLFIRDNLLKTGYSRVCLGHRGLRRQYLQASAALQLGSRRNPHQWIHHFRDLGLAYVLEQAVRQLPGEMVCHEGVLRLKNTDAASGTAYMETLRAYLDCGCNAVHTAKQLFIHRSTLLYRLEKIRALLGSDLQDADELLYLSLSLRLFDD